MLVPQFASIVLAFTHLVRKDEPFEWGRDAQEAAGRLREGLSGPLVLALPDVAKVSILCTDASDIAMGALLSREYDEKKPTAFLWRALATQQHSSEV